MAENNDFLDEIADKKWERRLKGLPELALSRGISPKELEYLHLIRPYVQVLDPDAKGSNSELRFVRAASGWLILDYGSAMASSRGERLFDSGAYIETEGGELEPINTGIGTIVMQIVTTAAEIVQIAKEKQWGGMQLVNAEPNLMKWAMWKAAEELGIRLYNYTPSKADIDKLARVEQLCPDTLVLHPTPSAK